MFLLFEAMPLSGLASGWSHFSDYPPDLGHAGVEFLEPLCIKMDLKAGVISSKTLDPDNGDRHSIQIALWFNIIQYINYSSIHCNPRWIWWMDPWLIDFGAKQIKSDKQHTKFQRPPETGYSHRQNYGKKKRFNLQAPPVYDRKVTNLFFA